MNPFLDDSSSQKRAKVSNEKKKTHRGSGKSRKNPTDAQQVFLIQLGKEYNASSDKIREEDSRANNDYHVIKFTKPTNDQQVNNIHDFIRIAKQYGPIITDACLTTGRLDNIYWVTFKEKEGFDNCVKANPWMSKKRYYTWEIGNYFRIMIRISSPDFTLDSLRKVPGFSSVESFRYTRSDTIMVYFSDRTDWINTAKAYEIFDGNTKLNPLVWSMYYKDSRFIDLEINPGRVILESEFRKYIEDIAAILKVPTPTFYFVSESANKKLIFIDRIWGHVLLWIQDYIDSHPMLIHTNWKLTKRPDKLRRNDEDEVDE